MYKISIWNFHWFITYLIPALTGHHWVGKTVRVVVQLIEQPPLLVVALHILENFAKSFSIKQLSMRKSKTHIYKKHKLTFKSLNSCIDTRYISLKDKNGSSDKFLN